MIQVNQRIKVLSDTIFSLIAMATHRLPKSRSYKTHKPVGPSKLGEADNIPSTDKAAELERVGSLLSNSLWAWQK